jgi:hypothetical protein
MDLLLRRSGLGGEFFSSQDKKMRPPFAAPLHRARLGHLVPFINNLLKIPRSGEHYRLFASIQYSVLRIYWLGAPTCPAGKSLVLPAPPPFPDFIH